MPLRQCEPLMPGSLMVQFNDWSWTLRTVGEKNGDSDGGVVRESQKYQQTCFLEAGASHRLVSKQEPESCCHLSALLGRGSVMPFGLSLVLHLLPGTDCGGSLYNFIVRSVCRHFLRTAGTADIFAAEFMMSREYLRNGLYVLHKTMCLATE